MILKSELISAGAKFAVFTVYKVFYLELLTIIVLYQPQDLQLCNPLIINHM
jgi:hypothetical protein